MMSFRFFGAFVILLSFPLSFAGCGGGASAGVSSKGIEPGGTHTFRDAGEIHVLPDEITIDTAYPGPPFGFAAANDQTVPLSTVITAGYNFGRSKASIIQSNDFSIQPGNYGDTAINAQFGGTINIGGFLAIVGVGSAAMEVNIRILDITDGVENARVIAVHPVKSYHIGNSMEIGMDLSLGAQLGSATIGEGSVDIGIGTSVPFDRTFARDSKDFGFTALLRRGHTYRFQVVSESRLEFGATGGRGIVSFYSPLAPIPNEIADPVILAIPPQILDASYWLDSVNLPILDQELPSLPLPTNGSQFTIPARNFVIPLPTGDITARLPSVTPKIRPLLPAPFDSVQNSNDILEALGYNTTVRDILAENINRPIPQDPLLIRGVELENLTIDLDNDDASDLKEIKELLKGLD